MPDTYSDLKKEARARAVAYQFRRGTPPESEDREGVAYHLASQITPEDRAMLVWLSKEHENLARFPLSLTHDTGGWDDRIEIIAHNLTHALADEILCAFDEPFRGQARITLGVKPRQGVRVAEILPHHADAPKSLFDSRLS